jgi:hypothetical protein
MSICLSSLEVVDLAIRGARSWRPTKLCIMNMNVLQTRGGMTSSTSGQSDGYCIAACIPFGLFGVFMYAPQVESIETPRQGAE